MPLQRSEHSTPRFSDNASRARGAGSLRIVVAGCRLLCGIRAKSNKSAAGAPPIAATSIRSPVSLLGYALGLLSRLPERLQPVHVLMTAARRCSSSFSASLYFSFASLFAFEKCFRDGAGIVIDHSYRFGRQKLPNWMSSKDYLTTLPVLKSFPRTAPVFSNGTTNRKFAVASPDHGSNHLCMKANIAESEATTLSGSTSSSVRSAPRNLGHRQITDLAASDWTRCLRSARAPLH